MGVENEEDKVKDIEDVKEDQGERMWLTEKGDKDVDGECNVKTRLGVDKVKPKVWFKYSLQIDY